jgi:hypothetical protein
MVDELPGRASSVGASPLEDQLRKIKDNPSHHAPKWGRIGRYANSAAASATANHLRRRHCGEGGVHTEGWRFETRRIDEGEASGLFAQYNPKEIQPGLREVNDKAYDAFKKRQTEAAKERRHAAQAKVQVEAKPKVAVK